MRQRALPLWDTKDLVTYTEVDEYRSSVYPDKGPRLIQALREDLALYAETTNENAALTCLIDINQNVVLLAALDFAWFDFSVEVFRACLQPAQTPPKLLQNLFDTALRQMAKRLLVEA